MRNWLYAIEALAIIAVGIASLALFASVMMPHSHPYMTLKGLGGLAIFLAACFYGLSRAR